jgi:hypothetical protein
MIYTFSVVIMSSSEEDVILTYRYLRQRKLKKRKYWIHPYNLNNIIHSSAVVSRELSQHEKKFKEFYRMTLESYRVLLRLVSKKKILILDLQYHQLKNYLLP